MVWQPLARPPNRFYMGKEKKIGFNYYLNKKLNSHVLDGKEHYPVYARITYNRNSTMFFFPLLYKTSYVTEAEFESFFMLRNDPKINEQINKFEEELSKIMRFEINVLGEKYSFKNLSNKRMSYHNSLTGAIEKHASQQLIKESYEYSKNEEILSLKSDYLSLAELYTLIKTMVPNVPKILSEEFNSLAKAYVGLLILNRENPIDHYIKMIDWIDGEFLLQYKNSIWGIKTNLKPYFPNEAPSSPLWLLLEDFELNKIEIYKYLNIINKAIVTIND